MYVYMYLFMHLCMCVCIYVCMYVFNMNVRMYIYMYICMYHLYQSLIVERQQQLHKFLNDVRITTCYSHYLYFIYKLQYV